MSKDEPMLVMEASRAARASAICRAVSGEWMDGEVMLTLGERAEEDEEGRLGDMEAGGLPCGLVNGCVGGGRGGGADELEAWADMATVGFGGLYMLTVTAWSLYSSQMVLSW